MDSLNSWASAVEVNSIVNNAFTITQEIAEKIATGEYKIQIKICVKRGNTVDNLTVHPMVYHAEDLDDTWQPYAPTNKALADTQNALAPIIGEYLPIDKTHDTKKRVVSIGETNTTFYVGGFMSKYGIVSTSDVNLVISAETSSGNVVAYNNVTFDSGTILITFDELTELTTFVCKCSKIQ